MFTLLRSRILTDAHELDAFARRFARRGGLRVEREVLARAGGLVRGFFNADGELVGGYAFNVEPPFRYLEHLPEAVETPPIEDCVEFGFLWMARSLPQLARLSIYARGLADMRRLGRRYCIAGSVHAKLVSDHRAAFPGRIYDGPVEVPEGRFHLRVYCGTLPQLVGGYLRFVGGRIARTIKRGRSRSRSALPKKPASAPRARLSAAASSSA